MLQTQVAVIGAGMAGLTAANKLQKKGIAVELFEKARGSGGRLSSKAIAIDGKPERVTFDLGCTHFQAKSEEFVHFLAEFVQKEKALPWPEHASSNNSAPSFVGAPRNSALTRAMAESLSTHFSTRVVSLTQTDNGQWQLWQETEEGLAPLCLAQHVILAVPKEQALDLLPEGHDFVSELSNPAIKSLAPQWVMGMVLPSAAEVPSELSQDNPVFRPVSDIIDQVVLESAKPHRSETPVLQVQANVAWTQARLEWDRSEVATALTQGLQNLLKTPLKSEATHVHRWLYSHVASTDAASAKSYLSSSTGLHICGDYLLSTGKPDGVESAFTSGFSLAQHLESLLG